jgi:spermidine synthase
MKKVLVFSCVVLGFSSLVSQVVVIRELAMSFYANEFFIGWILFCWLLGTGLGSAYGVGFAREAHKASRSLVICHLLVSALFPLAIVLIRLGKPIFGTPAGAFPELLPALAGSFAVLVPLCGVLGVQFTVTAKVWLFQAPEKEPTRVVTLAYLGECVGFIAGGVLFSFLLVFANEFRIAALLAVLNFAAAFAVYYALLGEKKNVLGILALLAVFFSSWLYLKSPEINRQTSQWRFPNEVLVMTENTVHGNVAVTKLGKQYNFYQSGLLLGADREDMASEFLVHFPMLAHPAPKKVLLLGTGFNGPLQQVLKHAPEEVRAVELDPALLKIARDFLPEDLRASLDDPRVRLETTDPRDFLRSWGGPFDVIIANFPDPSSVLVNRNYTEQFFRAIRSHLVPDGVFATHITFSANTLTPEVERLGSSVYATLSQAFKTVTVLPEDTLYFLALNDGAAPLDHTTMAGRLPERKLRPDFVNGKQIRYRLTNDRVGTVSTAFRNTVWKTKNTDLRPRTCYFMFLRWLSQFDPKIAEKFFLLSTVPFPMVLAGSLFLVLLMVILGGKREKGVRRLAQCSMGTAGFSLMAFEVAVIYLFQAAFGDLYYRLAWVITTFMAGLGAGIWIAAGFRKVPERFALAGLHVLNAVFFFMLIRVLVRLFSKGFFLGEEYQIVFLGLALMGGLAAGATFPFANRYYLACGGGEHPGHIYAADLWGSALGALITAGFLIPIWGVQQTLIFLGAVNVLLVPFFLFRKNVSGKDL